jgi:uncharacterized membrane protein
VAELALSAFCLAFPAVVLLLKEKVSFFSKWSPLIVCYAVGLLVGNLGILPARAIGVLDAVSTGAVALSIPLLLFSVDLRKWRELAGSTLLAFGLACLAVMAVSVVAHLAFRNAIPDSWGVAGLLVGVYTGGTPNMAAIKTALGTDMTSYLAVHTSDMVLSAIYFLFVLTVARRFFLLFMRPFARKPGSKAGGTGVGESGGAPGGAALAAEGGTQAADEEAFSSLFRKGRRGPLGKALLLDLGIVALGLGLSLLVGETWQTMVAILAITTLALAASLSKGVRATKGTFAAGEYILYVFCLAVGAMGDIGKLIGSAPVYFLYVAVVLFGSFALHAVLCALFKVDVDTFLVVSTATINSAPFVGLTCVALDNRDLIVPGITAGIMGYALGNYLGIGLAEVLRMLS